MVSFKEGDGKGFAEIWNSQQYSTIRRCKCDIPNTVVYTLVYKLFGDSTVEIKLELQHFHLADKFEIIENSQWLGEQA
jgi:hypothetical protein